MFPDVNRVIKRELIEGGPFASCTTPLVMRASLWGRDERQAARAMGLPRRPHTTEGRMRLPVRVVDLRRWVS